MSVQVPIETGLHDVWRIGNAFLIRAYGEWVAATSDQVLKIGALRKLMLERAGFVLTWPQHRLDAFVNKKLHAERQVIPHPFADACTLEEVPRLTDTWCQEYDIDRGAIEVYFHIFANDTFACTERRFEHAWPRRATASCAVVHRLGIARVPGRASRQAAISLWSRPFPVAQRGAAYDRGRLAGGLQHRTATGSAH